MANPNSLEPSTTSLGRTLQACVRLLHLDELLPPEGVSDALRHMEAELLGIGADAYRAEVCGARLSDAARDFERYLSLAKFHAGLEDMLTLSLPQEFLDWARRLISHGVPAEIEGMVRSLVACARRDDNAIRKALCRFLVFEAVRIQVLLRARLSPEQTYGVGMTDEEVDEIAEAEAAVWMDEGYPWAAEVESLEAIITAGLIRFEFHLEELRRAMHTISDELRDSLERRARLEARLMEFDARDALLIRNACAAEFDVQHLSVDLVRERHPAVFEHATPGAMHTRLSRLRNPTPAQILRRKETRLVDLIVNGAQSPAHSPVLGQ